MKVLVIAEHDNTHLKAQTLPVLTAALRLTSRADVLVIGHRCEAVAEAAAGLDGVARVRKVDAQHYEHFLAENLAMVVAQMAAAYTHVFLPASAFGKNLGPRVAAMLDVAQISEIIDIVDAETFVRPTYAGNVLETVRSSDPLKLVTVRPAAFAPVAKATGMAPIEDAPAGPDMGVSRWVGNDLPQNARPELATARVVVAGGRGLGSHDAYHRLLEPLADCLGAALGATRAAVDANYIPNDYQVGQTGKAVAPDVYIAVGISGAIQHVAGMRDAKLIVAINKDPDAPIFKVADVGLVGDLHEILPQLTDALRR
ncbi:electron transfer flavoprotein subunit alpha/FixB family protein [Uliginosibacterium sp. 31-16]|uniref:electron transfer flavoprotein subunit alpha/FixB family protein n=1 Tax=Uliginosibacterium sp. 31-16 TaxID=3068315 RepID=UPI00273D3F4D|nr:electron transfer flavoprotein subunit alpha/FixB family protein [Uliginosibacterium sp. 31-16]MDP5240179.1 electron transfer flavoprotein subunit alpha/FixB family protein [Uliginosibacterium sp. 31-16]